MKEFFKKFFCGAAIGAAMIIPGVSGGTVAVLFNVFDELIAALADIRKKFKESVLYLLPVLSGAVVAVCAMYYPLKFALSLAPFPTVMLFAGLMLGSCPKLIKEGVECGFKKINILSALIPLAVVIGICFIPSLGEADLSEQMQVGGYFLLVAIGLIASCALVLPGISGSMLLLIFGYYEPLLNTVSALKTSFGHALLVLALFAVGIAVGFFTIAKLIKFLLNKFPRGTRWAINGFVVGSVPALLITFPSNFADDLPISLPHIIVGIVLLVLGAIGSYLLTYFMEANRKKREQ